MNNLSIYDELNQAIEAIIANPDAPGTMQEPQVAELMGVVCDLRQLPRPDFKARLKTELEWVASARPLSSDRQPQAAGENILPSLFGNVYGAYPMRHTNFVASFALHVTAMLLVATLGVVAFKGKPELRPGGTVITLSDYVPPPGLHQPHGGGSGGDAEKTKPSQGPLPRTASEQFAPPEVDPNPSRLPVESTIIAPDLRLPSTDHTGDPLSALMTPSNGTGVRSGIGSDSGSGVGTGHGPGYGPGSGGNFGGEIFSVGNGVTAPRVIYDPEPEYSPEARAAKYQGTVRLWAVIGPNGLTREVHVAQSVGMGLDQKAVDAVKKWRFEPATMNGHPVAVRIEVEVRFSLY